MFDCVHVYCMIMSFVLSFWLCVCLFLGVGCLFLRRIRWG